MGCMKRSWVEINLSQISRNYEFYKEAISKQQKIMAVVKANGYGHGDIEVAKQLNVNGCYSFAVSNIEEAVKLREGNIKGDILILGYTPIEQVELLVKYDITQTLISEEYAEKLKNTGLKIKCHISLDTGMNRIGLDADNLEKCEKNIRQYYDSCLQVNGIFTHLCVADNDSEKCIKFTEKQIKKFESVVNRIRDLKNMQVHCLNSAGGLWYHSDISEYVRLGIILYGLKPDYLNVLPVGIEPALEWKSVVSMVKFVDINETIGYGRTFKVEKKMKVATIPTGYADGYSRLLSNKGYVLINGERAQIVGRICMDQFMVDVTDIENVEMGTEVVLIGRNGTEKLTADDMAHMLGTIGYEVVCNISNRVSRVYLN